MISLFGVDQDLINIKNKIREPVVILFQLTVVNKDKNTIEITIVNQPFTLKDWEKSYGPLTLRELKTYEELGYIKALPVTVTIQTF